MDQDNVAQPAVQPATQADEAPGPPEVERLIRVGHYESISFLLLLGIAMPLKYAVGWPHAVMVVGWAHGALFVWYGALVGLAHLATGWPVKWSALAMAAAFVPFGPWLIEGSLRRAAQTAT